MVANPSTLEGHVLKFRTQAPGLAPNAFAVVTANGTERVSGLYRISLELISPEREFDPQTILDHRAYFAILRKNPQGRGILTYKIHGTPILFEQYNQAMDWVRYRLMLVPRLWRLTQFSRSRIFQEMTIEEIVTKVLEEHQFSTEEFEFRLSDHEYPKREYVVQYQETDFQFLSRWLEQEGIFYYWEQGEDLEKVIFGDSPSAYGTSLGSLAYNPNEYGDDWFRDESIHSLIWRTSQKPIQFSVSDYNDRDPANPLLSIAPAIGRGLGEVVEFGTHNHKKDGEAEAYAHVRMGELDSQKSVIVGFGNCGTVRAGSTFTLQNHFRPDVNRPYFVTEVNFQSGQTFALTNIDAPNANLSCEFTAVPADIGVYRPPRITPKPRIAGILNGRIDAAEDAQYGRPDDYGRYKVRLPWDPAEPQGGKHSLPVRMGHQYAGPGYGLHLPVHPGMDALLAFENGDIDRPFIVTTSYTHENKSPVTAENYTQCIFKTGSDNLWVTEDLKDAESMVFRTPFQETMHRLGNTCYLEKENDKAQTGMIFATQGRAWSSALEGSFLTSGLKRDEDWDTEKPKEESKAGSDYLKEVAAVLSDAEAGPTEAGVQAPLEEVRSKGWGQESPSVNVWAEAGINLATKDGMTQVATKGISLVGKKGVSIVGGEAGITINADKGGVGITTKEGGIGITAAKDDVAIFTKDGSILIHACDDKTITIKVKDTTAVFSKDGLEIKAPKVSIKAEKETVEVEATTTSKWKGGSLFEIKADLIKLND